MNFINLQKKNLIQLIFLLITVQIIYIFKNIKDLNIIAQEEKLDLLDTCWTKDGKKITILN